MERYLCVFSSWKINIANIALGPYYLKYHGMSVIPIKIPMAFFTGDRKNNPNIHEIKTKILNIRKPQERKKPLGLLFV